MLRKCRPPLTSRLEFLFVEEKEARAAHLLKLISELDLPRNFEVFVENDEFEVAFQRHYERHLNKTKRLPPTFAFVDPFGWKRVSMDTVAEVMSHPSCEVFINFIYEEINRFIGHPDQERNFDLFFGCGDWRDCREIADPRSRNDCLRTIYQRQLAEKAGISYARSFEMKNASDVVDYYLFYGTNSLLGLQKMKETMWRVDRGGGFAFSDATNQDQLVLFQSAPNYALLERQLLARFAGTTVTVGEIKQFVLAGTAFRETHFKTQVLRKLELADEPQVKVVSAPLGRRIGTYANDEILIQFAE